MKQKILEKKKVLLSMGIIFLLGFFYFSFPKEEEIIENPLLEKPEEKNEKVENSVIQVDIKGAVKNPGVYQMQDNERVKDVIEKSGGLLENAFLNTINLSKKLEDEMVIIIYTKEEIDQLLEEETRTLKQENTCICPQIKNDACIKEATTNITPTKDEQPTSKQVSLNHGTKEDFETLTGIGPSKASAIIQYRIEHGRFESIEEIKNVSGIGEATYEKIKANLTL